MWYSDTLIKLYRLLFTSPLPNTRVLIASQTFSMLILSVIDILSIYAYFVLQNKEQKIYESHWQREIRREELSSIFRYYSNNLANELDDFIKPVECQYPKYQQKN